MTKRVHLISGMIKPLLLLLLATGSAAAAQADLAGAAGAGPARAADAELAGAPDAGIAGTTGAELAEPNDTDDSGAPDAEDAEAPDAQNDGASKEPEQQIAVADTAVRVEEERQVETVEQKGGFLGYNAVVTDGYGGRAFEYGYLHSSPSGGLFYNKLERESNFDLDGSFLNEHDYHGELNYDYRGDYRLRLRTESLYHNLDRELLFTPNFPAGRTDARTPAAYIARQDPFTNYGISAVQQGADFRYRLHNYPLHVNLGYWRYEKEGSIQQRFADAAFEGTPNTVYAVSRPIHYQTQEGRVGADAHLGPVDLIYDFRVRVFKDREEIPQAPYVPRNDFTGAPARVGGVFQHNEDPDSRFFSNTVKVHSSLSGGIVAAGSYSFQSRENLSRLSDTSGPRHLSAYLQNIAGDLAYTPFQELTVALKYRHQQLDNEDRGTVLSSNFLNPEQIVKPPVDWVKDLLVLSLVYKPRRDISVTGQYRGEFLRREHVSDTPTPESWALPGSSDTHTASLLMHYRPINRLRVDTSYSYTTTNHPSYGGSFQEKHEGKILATYSRNGSWGGSANAVIRRESNDEVRYYLVDYPFDPLSFSPYPLRSRDRRIENVNLTGWMVPFARITLAANYAYVRTEVDQPVLFTGVVRGSEAAADFLTRSHVYGISATYPARPDLDLSLMLQQVRSESRFSPADVTFSASSDTSGVTDISRQDTVISYLSARGEYRFTPEISGSLEYSIRDYDEKNPSYNAYDGTVHTVFAAVAAKW